MLSPKGSYHTGDGGFLHVALFHRDKLGCFSFRMAGLCCFILENGYNSKLLRINSSLNICKNVMHFCGSKHGQCSLIIAPKVKISQNMASIV